ncbi:MAG: inositol monophosphatase, partial [Proteobacteria bacterium]
MDMQRIKQVGTAAAHRGGKILRDHFGKLTAINKKGVIDLVTEADLKSEAAIIDTITGTFPDHAIIAEESGSKDGANGTWIIDPLDGTTNFAHNLPQFCVSIAFALGDRIRAGFVLAPLMGEWFVAIEGQGAERNGSPISVSNTPDLKNSLLVTGFPYDHQTIIKPLMKRFSNCLAA